MNIQNCIFNYVEKNQKCFVCQKNLNKDELFRNYHFNSIKSCLFLINILKENLEKLKDEKRRELKEYFMKIFENVFNFEKRGKNHLMKFSNVL